MELEIGMYVRTINGKIWVITSQQAISGHRKDIINASYNIIDLIEVGDYVNGKKVLDVAIDYIFDYSEEIKIVYFDIDKKDYIYSKVDIKSILTKEQFERCEYKCV